MSRVKKPVPMLELACGCSIRFHDGEDVICPTHGVQRVVQTRHIGAPRIRGAATGPHVSTQDLGVFTGQIAGTTVTEGPSHGR